MPSNKTSASEDTKVIFPAVTNRTAQQDIAGLIVDQLQLQADGYSIQIVQPLTLRKGFDTNNPTQSNISCTAGTTDAITGGTITAFRVGESPDITVDSGFALTISTAIVGNGATSGISKTGSGILTVSGANTFAGGAGVNAGTLVAKSASALGTTASGTGIDEGATLDVQADLGTEAISASTDNNTPSLGNFLICSAGTGRVGGPVTLNFGLNNEVLTVGGAGNLTIAGIISGSGNGVTKTGAGRTTLGGANTYTGPTTVTAGTLVVNGTQAGSAVAVANGGTLGGSGTVGPITAAAGAAVAPGLAATPVTLVSTGTATLTGATFGSVITGGATSTADQLAVQGVTLTGATLNVLRSGAAVPVGQAVQIIDNRGPNAVTGTFTGLAPGATLIVSGQKFTISYAGGDGNDVVLTATTAPVVLAPTTLPNPRVGTAYAQTITASGPPGPFTFAVTTGTLPAGLALSAAGALTGTPTAAVTVSFTVTATTTDNLTGSQAYTLTVGPAVSPVVVAPATLPNGQVGTAYSQTLTASGPAGPFTFAVTTGALPAGLTLSTAGVLAGTPTTATAATFTVTATNPAALAGSQAYTLTVGPAVSPPAATLAKEYAAGGDIGSGTATLYNPDQSPRFSVTPFGGTGGVRVAAADFNGDGVADLVVGTGPGQATQVNVYDGVSKAVLFTINPFESSFTGGVYVAAGDVNGDGTADLAITPDEGGGPRVRVFTGKGFGQIDDFFGIDDPNFRGGARAALGDLNGDGAADLVVAAGFGGGPRIAGFSGRSLGGSRVKLFSDFFAFEQTLRNGTFVAAGDVDGDGKAELIAGGGPGGGPRVTVFAGADLLNGVQTRSVDFFAGDPNSRGGVRVVMKNLDGDAKADLVTGSGTGAGSRVTTYAGKNLSGATPPVLFGQDAFPGFTGGVFVG